MAAPTLYTCDNYDSLVLRWLILEKEAPVTIVRGAYEENEIKPPYYVERDLHLFNHWVVLQYLQERYPSEVFMPVDPVTRAQIRQVCTLLREWSTDTERELYELLSGYPYLLGNNFTLADIYAGSRIIEAELKTTDRVKSYINRLLKRRAFMEAI